MNPQLPFWRNSPSFRSIPSPAVWKFNATKSKWQKRRCYTKLRLSREIKSRNKIFWISNTKYKKGIKWPETSWHISVEPHVALVITGKATIFVSNVSIKTQLVFFWFTNLATSIPHFLRVEIRRVCAKAAWINPGQLPWIMVHKLSPWKIISEKILKPIIYKDNCVHILRQRKVVGQFKPQFRRNMESDQVV